MAFRGLVGKEAVEGRRVFLQKDKDTGKPVRVRVRPVDPDLDKRIKREIRRLTKGRAYKDLKGNERLEIQERVDALEVERGCNALIGDSENFDYAPAGKKTAEDLSAALSREVTPEVVVNLDEVGITWPEKLKEHLFEAIPGFLDWVQEKAAKLSNFDADDEEETVESFR